MAVFEARAPGKVILLGEHAVVYGQPAIALPLDRGVHVRCAPAPRFELRTTPPGGGSMLSDALGELAEKLGGPRVGVEITSELPISAGLGSSAAVAVASVRALAQAAERRLDDAEVLELAEAMERSFHGRPSGIDHTTCTLGRPIRFKRGTPHEVTPLRVPKLQLVVAHVGPRATNTRERVLALRQRYDGDPRPLEPLFAEIGQLVERGIVALDAGDLRGLGVLMNRNQALLRELGMSTPRIDEVIARMRALGAHGAKLTGAGGGGAVIAVHDDPERLAKQLELEQLPAFVARWSDA